MAELEQAIANYRWAIEQLDEEITTENLLRLFYARDYIRELLENSPKMMVPHQTDLLDVDQALRQKAWAIADAVDMAQVRQTFNPDENAWWWFIDENLPPHPWDRFDWLWQTLTVSGWTINLSLLGDISVRFVSGGLGVGGTSAVVLPSILAALKARSDTKEKGQDLIKFALEKFGIKSHFREEAKLISTGILMGLLGSFWLALPGISKIYNHVGNRSFIAGEIEEAEENFKRAIALNSKNALAHYRLGYLYETWQDIPAAQTQYEIAVEQELPQANNNLARLYILDGRESEAIALLREALAELDEWNDPDDDNLRYNVLKNLGWARQKQGATKESQDYLQQAVDLSNTSSIPIDNVASSICLQAQTLEDSGQPEAALEKWQECCTTADLDNPDEDQWSIFAEERLEAAGQSCTKDTTLQYSPTNAPPSVK